MGWFLRLSCLLIVLFGLYVIWQFAVESNLRPPLPPGPQHHEPQSVPAAYRPSNSVPALPIDDVAQRNAL